MRAAEQQSIASVGGHVASIRIGDRGVRLEAKDFAALNTDDPFNATIGAAEKSRDMLERIDPCVKTAIVGR